jgi:antitoxin CptB
MAIDVAPTAAELGKLRWRCRRGMRELDVLLTRYVDEQYCDASEMHRAEFRRLLDSQDPLIYDYFLGRRTAPSPQLAALIARITAGRPNDQY